MLNVMAVKPKKALKTQVAMNDACFIACITLLPNFLNCMLKFFFQDWQIPISFLHEIFQFHPQN